MERDTPAAARDNESIETISEVVDSAVGDDGQDPDLDARDEAVMAADDTGMLRSERNTVRVEELGDVS